MVGSLIPGRGFACMVCGTDLWDVQRFVSAGGIVVCDACIALLKDAVDAAEGTGNTEVVLPPRVHGSAPDDEAAPAIAEAFARTFGSAYDQLDDYLEDADELGAVLADSAAQFGRATQFTGTVDRIRFANADLAEVRFQICMNGATTGFPFQGTARRGADGSWRVTRETIARVVPGGGGPPILRGRGR